MDAYYNENDKVAAHVLRELIRRDVIAPGDVDDRPIQEVQPVDLLGYTQCHFFAGGGLWSAAARLAGWPDDRPLWTGSCPCQPFSAAGKGGGTDDPRHLWPDLYRLVSACRPPVVMGEQVAGAAGYGWFDGVRTDLAREGYASRAVDIPVCAVDGPHQRNRLWWIAVADGAGERRAEAIGEPRDDDAPPREGPDARAQRAHGDDHGLDVDDGERKGLEGQRRHGDRRIGRPGEAGSVAPTDGRLCPDANRLRQPQQEGGVSVVGRRAGNRDGGSFWADHEWIVSPVDGKARRTKPGLPFLVDGLPGRVGLWRICGNAISPVLAAEVIAAFLDTE